MVYGSGKEATKASNTQSNFIFDWRERDAEVCWHLGAQDAELVQFLFGFKGEGRNERCWVAPLSITFAAGPTAGVHTSPASVVFATLKNVFGVMVLPVPEPRRIP